MHNPMLSKMIAEARIADLTRTRRQRARAESSAPKIPSFSHVTLRYAFPIVGGIAFQLVRAGVR